MSAPTASKPALPSRARVLVTFLLVASGLAAFSSFHPASGPSGTHEMVGVGIFGFGLLLAPVLFRLRSFAAQIFGRALLFQLSVFGGLALVSTLTRDASMEMITAAAVLFGTGVGALLIMRGRGLDLNSNTFAPIAFRHTLIASLLFGLADMWALMFYGFMERFDVALLACAAMMAVSLFGLFRLKVWGLIACVAANVVVAALALSGVLDLPNILSYGLVATAGIQILLPAPIVRRMLRPTS